GLVFTTRSPPAATAAPKAIPGKIVPSARASRAGPKSPTRGSTIELDSGKGNGLRGTTGTADPAIKRPSGPGRPGARTCTDMVDRASLPASRDRYAGLTGPAPRTGPRVSSAIAAGGRAEDCQTGAGGASSHQPLGLTAAARIIP